MDPLQDLDVKKYMYMTGKRTSFPYVELELENLFTELFCFRSEQFFKIFAFMHDF